MPIDIKIPSVGESITEGTISRWLKNDGDAVHEGDPILELETEKATTEIPAPASGVLHITAREGKTIAIGTVVGAIEEGAAPAKETKKDGKPAAKPKEKEPEKLEKKREPVEAATHKPAARQEPAPIP